MLRSERPKRGEKGGFNGQVFEKKEAALSVAANLKPCDDEPTSHIARV